MAAISRIRERRLDGAATAAPPTEKDMMLDEVIETLDRETAGLVELQRLARLTAGLDAAVTAVVAIAERGGAIDTDRRALLSSVRRYTRVVLQALEDEGWWVDYEADAGFLISIRDGDPSVFRSWGPGPFENFLEECLRCLVCGSRFSRWTVGWVVAGPAKRTERLHFDASIVGR